jgi:hypothetical protein
MGIFTCNDVLVNQQLGVARLRRGVEAAEDGLGLLVGPVVEDAMEVVRSGACGKVKLVASRQRV